MLRQPVNGPFICLILQNICLKYACLLFKTPKKTQNISDPTHGRQLATKQCCRVEMRSLFSRVSSDDALVFPKKKRKKTYEREKSIMWSKPELSLMLCWVVRSYTGDVLLSLSLTHTQRMEEAGLSLSHTHTDSQVTHCYCCCRCWPLMSTRQLSHSKHKSGFSLILRLWNWKSVLFASHQYDRWTWA